MSLHGKREHPYLGYVNLRELNSIRSELGGPVEHDLNFIADKPRQRSTTWKRQNGHKRRRAIHPAGLRLTIIRGPRVARIHSAAPALLQRHRP